MGKKIMKAGDFIQTPHGTGTVKHFEVFPPLRMQGYVRRSAIDAPDYPIKLPDDMDEGVFVRVGVAGAHPTLNVAYYTARELGLESFSRAKP
jgi:hypothetical protein